MTKEEKIKFVMEVLEKASYRPHVKFDYDEEVWIHRCFTNSGFENSLRVYDSNLESAYQVALKIKEKI